VTGNESAADAEVRSAFAATLLVLFDVEVFLVVRLFHSYTGFAI
jgi:hypothetical protein